MKLPKLNIAHRIFPRELWTRAFVVSIVTGLLTFVAFDVMWCIDTTFRSMSFVGTYLSALLGALVLAMPTALCPRLRWLQVAAWCVADEWLMANLMYCRTYYSWLSASDYTLIGNVLEFGGSITDSLRWRDLLLVLITGAGSVGLYRIKQQAQKAAKYYFLSLAVLVAAMAVYAFARGGMKDDIDNLSQECYYATSPAVIYTPAGPVLAEMFATKEELTDADRHLVDNWLSTHRQMQKYEHPGRAERTSLVLIFCESLESWVVGAHTDDGEAITPFLNSLIENDSTVLYASKVVSQADRGRSIDAQLLMVAGLLPMQNGVYAFKAPDNTYHTLPKALKAAHGGKAMLLTPDKPVTWNQQRVAEAFGVDTVVAHDAWRMEQPVGNPAKLGDAALMRQTVDKLRSGLWPVGEKRFLQIVTYSGHNPFRLPDNLKKIHPGDAYPPQMADYMAMANYTDSALATLVHYLKTRPDYADMMIVIVGDHEGLGTYRSDWLKNKAAARLLNPHGLVPLIVVNSPVTGTIDFPIGEVDVYSTILDLMNLDDYAWHGLGLSALNPSHPRAAVDARMNLVGQVPNGVANHLRQARRVSDRIITFDMQ